MSKNPQQIRKWAIALHGGAGAIARPHLSSAQQNAYRDALSDVIECGAEILARGGSALDAVETSVRLLEDDPLFNAGRGAVFTAGGRNELDAAIMDGATLKAGAVAGITHTRFPISLARAVMEHSPHVMLMGEQAEMFGQQHGLEQASPGAFFTERRWRALVKFLQAENLPIPQSPAHHSTEAKAALAHDEGAQGTVGVVACDKAGNIAAGTSTGGITGKRWGRIGDSPIIGAGTYAANVSCAVSATGAGEYFIRLAVAHRIASIVEFKGLALQDALDAVILNDLSVIGGSGGVIAVNTRGEIAWSFNTSGMYRACAADGVAPYVGMYGDD